MACPYFMPVERFENGAWQHPGRLPLGGGWRGHCTAPGHEGESPAESTQERYCNLGYASNCDWAPPERAWDAVRFAVCAPPRSEPGDSVPRGRTLRLRYVCERDHRPVESGDLEFDPLDRKWIGGHSDLCVQKMADCFVDSFLRSRGQEKVELKISDSLPIK